MEKLTDRVHTFDNGIKVFQHHLLSSQMQRYDNVNLHEPVEERWVKHCLDHLEPDRSLFLDVGAGIGYYALLAKQHSPDIEIHLVEPNPKLQKAIWANVELNGIGRRDFHLHPFAVTNHTGTSSFYLKDFSSSLIQGPQRWVLEIWDLYRRRVSRSRIISVDTTTLDEILDRLDRPVGLIKIDVQGTEVRVLRGAACSLSHNAIEFLVIGTHSRRIHSEILGLLGELDCEFLFEAAVVEHQPDGLIVCRLQP